MSSQASASSFLDSHFPVLLPYTDALFLSPSDFETFISTSLRDRPVASSIPVRPIASSGPAEHSSDIDTSKLLEKEKSPSTSTTTQVGDVIKAQKLGPDGMMRTDNQDLAVRDTKSPLVDLFFELDDSICGENLRQRLEAAWDEDATVTLKIIFNARSIHLGKSSRLAFYKACGWLAQNHPYTLIFNLAWLVRPVIDKKMEKDTVAAARTDGDDDEGTVMVELEQGWRPDDDLVFDVKDGVAHGYWKDLLNLIALAAQGELKVDGEPRTVLNVTAEKKFKRDWTLGRERRHAHSIDRHINAVTRFHTDPVYRCLHLAIARLFAEQLKLDMAHLKTAEKADIRRISLAAKWAPTSTGFHDKHTFIASTVAELLYPHSDICRDVPLDNRELYLRYAREAYRKHSLSPLRKFLQIVERDITAGTFSNIKYDRVPSLAMDRYTTLFATKDYDRFDQYLGFVASGKRKISGAVMLPSVLVAKVRDVSGSRGQQKSSSNGFSSHVKSKLRNTEEAVANGQWNTLVGRIKASGTISSSIAICDVSGSMYGPHFPDGTCPMDSAIGLSLLLAEVTSPPFGGRFITFSARPEVHKVGGADDPRSFTEKINGMASAEWGMNTDFVAVFERLLLPMAVENKLKPEEMVKQVFVFSDMHFDEASGVGRWSSSYDRIKAKYSDAGYPMPTLIFWNLAGGRSGGAAPKPVDSDEQGTALVSGYSQAQLKVFLDDGQFVNSEEAAEVTTEDDSDDDEEAVIVTKRIKIDPLVTLQKTIGHRAFSMLKVVD